MPDEILGRQRLARVENHFQRGGGDVMEPKSWDHSVKAGTKTMQAKAEEFWETCPENIQTPPPSPALSHTGLPCPTQFLHWLNPSQKPTWAVEPWGGVGWGKGGLPLVKGGPEKGGEWIHEPTSLGSAWVEEGVLIRLTLSERLALARSFG